MAHGARALALTELRRGAIAAARVGSTPWWPTWSAPAALRATRAAVVMPGLFAICDQVIGNLQMATFAAFGGFATLVLAGFGGSRRDKLIAHAGLAIVGTALVTIGTAVSSSTAVAAVVTVPVAFAVFFAGVAGPNAASGALAAMLAYVLPAASPGTIAMVPDRLAGWWLASVAGTAAVLATSSKSEGNPLRSAASKLASVLADEIDATLRGEGAEAGLAACMEAKRELLARFTTAQYRPTGLASTDQALANAVQLLEWCTSLLTDSVHERNDLRDAPAEDRELLAAAAGVLRDAGALLVGAGDRDPDLDRLERCRRRSIDRLQRLAPETGDFTAQARVSFHACAIAIAVLGIGAEALVAARMADLAWAADARGRWFAEQSMGRADEPGLMGLSNYAGLAARQASLRSVWFINSARAALALAAAVAIADLTTVQHGFWVVLGTLSVLRTNASATGSTAVRALAGTAIGFVIGGALLVAIGSSTGVLWAALPVAVFVAAYAPGTAPFVLGQAAFTVTVAVLFNLLVPVGWKVGVVRIEDVAIGCAVSIVIGTLFWPRGAASVVGDDLADAYRAGASYLTEAVQWVCRLRAQEPDGARRAVTAGQRLDEALRGLLTEQGTKHMPKHELWRLVGGSLRLRLTAHAVSELPRTDPADDGAREVLEERSERLEAWFERLAEQFERPRGRKVPTLAEPSALAPVIDGREPDGTLHSRQTVWLGEYLDHLSEHLCELVGPATHVAEIRRGPWWR